jgi:hypothetical protein
MGGKCPAGAIASQDISPAYSMMPLTNLFNSLPLTCIVIGCDMSLARVGEQGWPQYGSKKKKGGGTRQRGGLDGRIGAIKLLKKETAS